jgi:hypothetical protein
MQKYNPQKPLFSIHVPKCAGTSFDKVLESWFTDNGTYLNIQNRPNLQRYFSNIIKLGIPKVLKGDRLFRHYRQFSISYPPQYYNIKFIQYFTKKPICIHGHIHKEDEILFFKNYPDADQFISILRDPLDMHLSLYHYNKKRIKEGDLYWDKNKPRSLGYEKEIDYWVAEVNSLLLEFIPFNQMNENNYKELINKYFIHIGIVEDLKKTIKILSQKLGFDFIDIPLLNNSERNEIPSDEAVNIFKKKHKLEYLIYEYTKSLNL